MAGAGAPAGGEVDPFRRGALHGPRALRDHRLPPQPRPHGDRPMKLHTKIFIGLVAGAVCGLAANFFAGGADWVHWFATNVAGPVGQIFLRLLLMTVVPLVFTSITLRVAQLGDIRKVGTVGGRSLAYFL